MTTHEHRLPATPDEWADVIANTYGQEYCTRCGRALGPVVSLTSCLDVARDVPSLRRILTGLRHDFGPWAVVALCFNCGDVACWPITEQDRRDVVHALTGRAVPA